MFDPRWVREHAEEFDRGLARRGLPSESKKIMRSTRNAAP